MATWSEKNIPEDLRGKVYVITGTSAGIGTEMARFLSRAGATVIGGNRSNDKAYAALDAAKQPGEDTSTFKSLTLDLLNKDSLLKFAAEVSGLVTQIDGLILNAGVMAIPERQVSSYGVEAQVAANVAAQNLLGHHLLTSLLLPQLLASPAAVVVSTSSGTVKMAGARSWDDINSERSYDGWAVYAMTKTMALQWRTALKEKLAAAGLAGRIKVVASHPGGTASSLQIWSKSCFAIRASITYVQDTDTKTWMGWLFRSLRFLYMRPAQGCLGSLQAVLDASVPDGGFVGPWLEGWGNPRVIADFQPSISHNKELIERTWNFLEEAVKPQWPWTGKD